jgi:hypothetical protein
VEVTKWMISLKEGGEYRNRCRDMDVMTEGHTNKRLRRATFGHYRLRGHVSSSPDRLTDTIPIVLACIMRALASTRESSIVFKPHVPTTLIVLTRLADRQ